MKNKKLYIIAGGVTILTGIIATLEIMFHNHKLKQVVTESKEQRQIDTTTPANTTTDTAQHAINNPGNIKTENYKFTGEVPSPSPDFKSFDTLANGFLAMIVKLKYFYENYGDTTLRKLIYRYAPPSDNNDSAGYVNFVAQHTGINPDDDIHPFLWSDKITGILANMAIIEQGQSWYDDNSDLVDSSVENAYQSA